MSQTKAVVIFIALVVAFAILIEGAMAAVGFTGLLATAVMWSIAISAMLALTLTGQDLSSLGWKWGPARYHVIAFLLPILYGGAGYAIASAAGLVTFPSADGLANLQRAAGFQSLPATLGLAVSLLLIATAGMVGSMSTALGEEIGWRGFLTPRLTAMSGFVVATLITGIIWGAWHMPMLVFSDYNAGGDKAYEMASFAVFIVSGSAVYAWLRLESGSLWPAATLHASHNLFIQNVFDPLAVRGDNPITMVGEFGVVTAAVGLLCTLPFWILGIRRYGRAAKASAAPPPAS
jgi:uncharacterized protein